LFFTSKKQRARYFDDRVTLQKRDKIPYGTFVAYDGLKEIFPKAAITVSRQEPGYWDSLSNYDDGQALIIVSRYFNANENEMKKIVRFMEEGNDVFISSMYLSYDARQFMKCNMNAYEGLVYELDEPQEDGVLSVSLTKPPFQNESYTYPGRRHDFYFYKLDTATTTVLGYDKDKKPNFIHLKAGKGNLYVHLAPMTFTNYFLLHKNNISYYENVLSVISPQTTRVVWDEYYTMRRESSGRERPGWFGAFLKHDSLKWALLIALLVLLIYVLLESRRKQRVIPVIKKPANDSLEFVKTIGRLYHDKGDHKNLCKKMSAYFLEHVRSRYKLPTSELDEVFEKNLHFKTGITQEEIYGIVSFIRQLDSVENVSEKQLASFHKQLESFYKKA
jgi:hypothetical protein